MHMEKNLDLNAVLKIMDQIWGYTLHGFKRSSYSSEIKEDTSIVTEIDKGAERLLRDYVKTQFPSHGVIGEEFFDERSDADYQWIVDPIDGTQNFFHGIPTWGTILGVHYQGTPVFAVVDHPGLDLRLWAAKGEGAYCNGQRIKSQDNWMGNNSIVGLSTRGMFARCGHEDIFNRIVEKYVNHRIYFDVYATTLAVLGSLDLMYEYNVTAWDMAATELLVTEAGGAFKMVSEIPREGLPPRLSAVFGKQSCVIEGLNLIIKK